MKETNAVNAAGSAVICETHGAVALVRLNREET
jgi:hypothetical protein